MFGGFVHMDVLSAGRFFPTALLSHRTFVPPDVLSLDVMYLAVLPTGRFVPLDVFRLRTFCPGTNIYSYDFKMLLQQLGKIDLSL
jgi:hypothetical protein